MRISISFGSRAIHSRSGQVPPAKNAAKGAPNCELQSLTHFPGPATRCSGFQPFDKEKRLPDGKLAAGLRVQTQDLAIYGQTGERADDVASCAPASCLLTIQIHIHILCFPTFQPRGCCLPCHARFKSQNIRNHRCPTHLATPSPCNIPNHHPPPTAPHRQRCSSNGQQPSWLQ